MPDFNFFDWFDKVEREAAVTDVGRKMLAAGFTVYHTGGGCLAWQKKIGETYVWVCDLGNGLGDKIDEEYLVGHYDKDHEILAEGVERDLDAAINWSNERSQRSQHNGDPT